jgi:DNA-binding NarL/FixJ family response regulator
MPLTVLVADDDPGVRLCIGDFLKASGYSVVLAGNGQEAFAVVESLQPHLVVTDIAMPVMDGYELVSRVRQCPSLRLLPVIFLTERTKTQERIKGYQLGCDVFLPKPFELQELGAVIRNLLERSQLIQAAWQYTYQDQAPNPLPTLSPSGHPSSPSQLTDELAPYRQRQTSAIALESLPESSVKRRSVSCVELPFSLHLTEREQKVLELIVDGLSNAQIGDRLYLSPRTVEKYVSSLLRKTSTINRAELVHFAMKHCLLS